LLVNAGDARGPAVYQVKSRYSNSVVIDDGGAGLQTYPYSQGYWYGNPGVTLPHFDATSADYTYMQGNYAAAYNWPGHSPNPASELVRDVFYVRGSSGNGGGDYIVVYDRATTAQPQFTKQLQWNFTATPTVSGDAWAVTVGSSKLFGQTYSDAAITTTARTVTVEGAAIQELTTNNAAPAASVRYVTAMQVAPSAAVVMDASTHVESSDGKLEGVQIGSYVVLFGRNGAVAGGVGNYSVNAPSGQTLTHYLSDLAPGVTYTLAGADQSTATANPQGVLSFTSAGTGAVRIVALTPQ